MKKTENKSFPTTIVIFGGTGDLAYRKLFPALFSLYCEKMLPKKFQIVGFSRQKLTEPEYKAFVANALRKKGHYIYESHVQQFLRTVHYIEGNFLNPESYKPLATRLHEIDHRYFGSCANKLFHLAVPPAFYQTIFPLLASSRLTMPCGGSSGWTRVIVEKPFGRDIDTARQLDQLLGKLFHESQIFRIDHYLGKETLRNILAFRFSNTLFEPIWNREYIERVEIKVHERLGVEGRGKLYDDIGALRDVGQNHLLQMLAAVAMENPCDPGSHNIRDERAKVFRSLKKIGPHAIKTSVVRGQYRTYRKEKAVNPASTTETFFRITSLIDNERWKGVPFVLESGKKLKTREAVISIIFKGKRSCIFLPEDPRTPLHNILRFRIQPNEAISLRFWAKKPGLKNVVLQKKLAFRYRESAEFAKIPDDYAILLSDCIVGDQTLFTSTEEVQRSWEYITPILKQWHTIPLQMYEPHSDGPPL